jgi:hypothetical protein
MPARVANPLYGGAQYYADPYNYGRASFYRGLGRASGLATAAMGAPGPSPLGAPGPSPQDALSIMGAANQYENAVAKRRETEGLDRAALGLAAPPFVREWEGADTQPMAPAPLGSGATLDAMMGARPSTP